MRMVWRWMPCARAGLQGASRLLLGFTLLQLWNAPPLRAEWSLVERNDKAKIYVDAESISRNGDMVSVWVLDDLKTDQNRGLSTFFHSCSGRTRLFQRTLSPGDHWSSLLEIWGPVT